MFDLKHLIELREVIRLPVLARRAGIPVSTLYSKIRRYSDLTTTQSQELKMALRTFGLDFDVEHKP